MDELEKRLTHTVTREGKSWTFRRPTARQMLAADVLAAQMRLNTPVNATTYAVGMADMIASLNTYVVEPKGHDFGGMYDDEVGEIYQEVMTWLQSFRAGVGEGEGTLG